MGSEHPRAKPPFKMTPVVLHVLLSMATGEVHGYRIMQEVESRTRGGLRIAPGSLYFTLNRLQKADLIVESDERPDPKLDDARRKYYRLTEYGRAVLREEVQTLAEIVSLARDQDLLPGTGKA